MQREKRPKVDFYILLDQTIHVHKWHQMLRLSSVPWDKWSQQEICSQKSKQKSSLSFNRDGVLLSRWCSCCFDFLRLAHLHTPTVCCKQFPLPLLVTLSAQMKTPMTARTLAFLWKDIRSCYWLGTGRQHSFLLHCEEQNPRGKGLH